MLGKKSKFAAGTELYVNDNNNNGKYICVFESTVVNLATYRQFTIGCLRLNYLKKTRTTTTTEKKTNNNNNDDDDDEDADDGGGGVGGGGDSLEGQALQWGKKAKNRVK